MKASSKEEILSYIRNNPSSSSSEIHKGLVSGISYATVKRILSSLTDEQLVISIGAGRGTRYTTGPASKLFYPVDLTLYFEKEIDEREIRKDFNLHLISDVLHHIPLFNRQEILSLEQLHQTYLRKRSGLSNSAYQKEMERLAIDFSWKSSQIEGNTYTLLETERLLKEKETAEGKSRDDAIMLLNHKTAIDYIVSSSFQLFPIDRSKIEKVHTMLMTGLGIELYIRTHGVGITGTNYKPPEYEQQIFKALNETCSLVNSRENIFEQALLLLLFISYIQPFVDGNKRTARIMSNAALIHNGYCPVSFRTIDALEYKKAMLLFYEQNNISAFKRIFIDQCEFAVTTYF